MIDKLLARIAKRGSSAEQVAPVSILAGGSHGAGLPSSSSAGQDPFSTIFPAPARLRSARSGKSVPGQTNAWQVACDTYVNGRLSGVAIASQPALFAPWTPAHMAVAQMLWAEHEQLHLGEVHIHSGDALLAVMQPARRQVAVRATAYQPNAPLALRQLPARSASRSANASMPHLGDDFQEHSLYSLLWFYGQVYAAAPELLPAEMGSHLIQLRRFPLVEPAALEMRHLALIHIFSGGAISFTQLQRLVSPEHAKSLCPDLASLYFTGALRLLDDTMTPPAVSTAAT
jgi:hypothetical protein